VLLDILCAQRHKRMPYGSRSWPVASRNDHISRYKYASVCCAAVQLQFDTFMFQAFLACYWLLANGTNTIPSGEGRTNLVVEYRYY
jgi:hypothetical protein